MQVVELGGSRNDEVAHEGVGVGAVLGVGEDHLRNGKLKKFKEMHQKPWPRSPATRQPLTTPDQSLGRVLRAPPQPYSKLRGMELNEDPHQETIII